MHQKSYMIGYILHLEQKHFKKNQKKKTKKKEKYQKHNITVMYGE